MMKDLMDRYNPDSIRDNKEYIFGIYRNPILGLLATTGRSGGETKASIEHVTSQLSGAYDRVVAIGHTHGSDVPGYNEYEFSNADKEMVRKPPSFVAAGALMYLGAPSGHFLVFDPKTDAVYDLSNQYGCILTGRD